MNKENCTLKLVDEIILYYDAWLKKTSNYNRRTSTSTAGFKPAISSVVHPQTCTLDLMATAIPTIGYLFIIDPVPLNGLDKGGEVWMLDVATNCPPAQVTDRK